MKWVFLLLSLALLFVAPLHADVVSPDENTLLMPIGMAIEAAVALALLFVWKLPLRYAYIALFVTLVSWPICFIVPALFGVKVFESLPLIAIAELFVIVIEASILYHVSKKEIPMEKAFAMSFLMNMASLFFSLSVEPSFWSGSPPLLAYSYILSLLGIQLAITYLLLMDRKLPKNESVFSVALGDMAFAAGFLLFNNIFAGLVAGGGAFLAAVFCLTRGKTVTLKDVGKLAVLAAAATIAVILIAAYIFLLGFVIGGFSHPPPPGQRISQADLYWFEDARPFVILADSVSSNGTMIMELQDMEAGSPLVLTGINASFDDGGNSIAVAKGLPVEFLPGEVKVIELTHGGKAAPGAAYDYHLELTYKTRDGTEMKETGNKTLVGKYT